MTNTTNIALVQLEVRKVINNYNLTAGLFSRLEEARILFYANQYKAIMEDGNSTTFEKVQASQELLITEGFLKLYKMMQDMGLDTSGMTPADIVETVLGEKLSNKNNVAGAMIGRVDSSLHKAKETTFGFLNKGARWLANKTER